MVNFPSVMRAISTISKPMFSPKVMRKMVVATFVAKPSIVKIVWNFLLVRSFIGNARLLIYTTILPFRN